MTGEIASMMLDGTMCAGCGEFLNDREDGDGYPEYCSACAPDYIEEKPKTSPVKKFKTPAALMQSITDKTIACVLQVRQLTPENRKRLSAEIQQLLSGYILPTNERP